MADLGQLHHHVTGLDGADAEADGDWGYQYYGNGASSNAGDVTATDATAKVGDTVTIGVSFPTEVVYTWFMAPVLVAETLKALAMV